MTNKLSDIELCCAMMDDIIEYMDFKIKIEDGQFALIDLLGAYWGDIGNDRFSNLDLLLDRLDIYIKDYFFDDMDELLTEKSITELDKWDYTKAGIAFICSERCSKLRTKITPNVYKKVHEKFKETRVPSSEDTRNIIPTGMIFHGELWTGCTVKEYYGEDYFATELQKLYLSGKFYNGIVLDFSDKNILSEYSLYLY